MEGEKKHACACGGTCGREQRPEDTAAPNAGEAIARAAIDEMAQRKEKKAPKPEGGLDDSVDAFLETCAELDQDPMDVVAHIARREGISISGEAPEDGGKRRAYDLLRAVVTRLVTDFSSDLAEECGFETDPLARLVLEAFSFGRRVPREYRGPSVRAIPTRAWYAVSF